MQLESNSDTPAPASEAQQATHFPQDNPWLTVTEEESGTRPPLMSRLWQSHIHKTQDTSTTPPSNVSIPKKDEKKVPESANADIPSQAFSSAFSSNEIDISLKATRGNEHSNGSNVHVPTKQIAAPEREKADEDALSQHIWQDKLPAGGSIDPRQERRLPQLRVIGQLSQSYIITEGD